jgi:hypothetical protein
VAPRAADELEVLWQAFAAPSTWRIVAAPERAGHEDRRDRGTLFAPFVFAHLGGAG